MHEKVAIVPIFGAVLGRQQSIAYVIVHIIEFMIALLNGLNIHILLNMYILLACYLFIESIVIKFNANNRTIVRLRQYNHI